MEDATFWQPLALGTIQPHSLTAVPADVQSFVGAEWGHVRSFALPAFAPRPADRPGRVAAAGSVERRVQARRGGRPARDLGRRKPRRGRGRR